MTTNGRVTDCSGNPVPNASVTLTVTVDDGQTRTATVTSDSGGNFSATVRLPYSNGTRHWKLGTRCHEYNLGTVKVTSGSASWTDPIYIFQYTYYCP
jgi:hypothetical protein